MNKFLVNLGLLVFLVFSLGLTILYFSFLSEKINRPTFKNLDTEGFIIFGALIGLFLVADFFILKKFAKDLKKEIKAIKKEIGAK